MKTSAQLFTFVAINEDQYTREFVVRELKTSQQQAARMVVDEVQNGKYTTLHHFNIPC